MLDENKLKIKRDRKIMIAANSFLFLQSLFLNYSSELERWFSIAAAGILALTVILTYKKDMDTELTVIMYKKYKKLNKKGFDEEQIKKFLIQDFSDELYDEFVKWLKEINSN